MRQARHAAHDGTWFFSPALPAVAQRRALHGSMVPIVGICSRRLCGRCSSAQGIAHGANASESHGISRLRQTIGLRAGRRPRCVQIEQPRSNKNKPGGVRYCTAGKAVPISTRAFALLQRFPRRARNVFSFSMKPAGHRPRPGRGFRMALRHHRILSSFDMQPTSSRILR